MYSKNNYFDIIKSKTFDSNDIELIKVIKDWKIKNYKIVFTNGCFDILHYGHINYLIKASELGDVLVVGLNSDKSISSIKGNDRPIMDEITRKTIMSSLNFVDAVILFDDDNPIDIIKKIKPDIIVKGSDYKKEEIIGYKEILSYGGYVILLDYIDGYSTSKIIEKIRSSTF